MILASRKRGVDPTVGVFIKSVIYGTGVLILFYLLLSFVSVLEYNSKS